MKNLRITTPPPLHCKYFEVIKIYKTANNKMNADRIRECDCFMEASIYLSDDFKIRNNYDDSRYKEAHGFIIHFNKDEVLATLRRIKWRDYSARSLDRIMHLNKGDIIEAFNEEFNK